MDYWAVRDLGYAEVVGVELLPGTHDSTVQRRVPFEGDSFEFTVHNFVVARPDLADPGYFRHGSAARDAGACERRLVRSAHQHRQCVCLTMVF